MGRIRRVARRRPLRERLVSLVSEAGSFMALNGLEWIVRIEDRMVQKGVG